MGKEFKNLGQICKAKQVIGGLQMALEVGFSGFGPCLPSIFGAALPSICLSTYLLDSGSLSHPFPGLNFNLSRRCPTLSGRTEPDGILRPGFSVGDDCV